MELFVDLRTLAELIGVTYETARRFRYHDGKGAHWREPSGFPEPWGTILQPGRQGSRAPVFALSEVLDWIAENRPYDLRIALELGNVGRDLGRLEERHRADQASRASRAST